MRTIFAAIAAAAMLVFTATGGMAANLDPYGPYYENGTCKTGDVSGAAIDCFGSVTGISNAQQVDVNNATFIDSATNTTTTGLFGITGWKDVFVSSTVGATFGQVNGTFDVNWNLGGSVAVLLKFGNTWAAYLYNGLTSGQYTYDLSGMITKNSANSLSNFRIVQANPIPVPAALPLLGLGLVGLGLVGRRRKSA